MDGRRTPRRMEALETEDIQPSPAFQRKLDELAKRLAGDVDSVQGGAAKRGRGRPRGSRKSKESPPNAKRPVGRPPKSPRLQAGGLDELEGKTPQVQLVSEIAMPRSQPSYSPSLMAAGADRQRSKDAWGSRSMSGGIERYKPRAASPQRTPKRSKSPSRMAAAGLDESPGRKSPDVPKKQPVRIITSDALYPMAAAGSEDNELRGAAPAYGGDNDPENVLFLAQYLADNYKRISLDQACREDIDKVDEEDGTIDLEIWYKNKGRWDRMGNDVQTRWAKRLKDKPGSVCSSLVKDLLGFSDSGYAKIRYKFDDTSGYFMEGIYKAKTDNVPKFAVLVEMPTGMSLKENLLKGGVGALGLTTLLGGIGAKYLYDKSQNMYKGQIDVAEGLKVVEDAIADTDKKISNIERKGQKQNDAGTWVSVSGYTPPDKDIETLTLLNANLENLKIQRDKYTYRAAYDKIKELEADQQKLLNGQQLVDASAEVQAKYAQLDGLIKKAKITALGSISKYNENRAAMVKSLKDNDAQVRKDFREAVLEGIKQVQQSLKNEDKWNQAKLANLKDDAKYLDALSAAIQQRTGLYRRPPDNLRAITDLGQDATFEAAKAAIYDVFPEIMLEQLIAGNNTWSELNRDSKIVVGDILTKLNDGTRPDIDESSQLVNLWTKLVNKKYGVSDK